MNTDTPETESTMPERDNLWAKHDGLTPRCCADMIALAGKLEIERNQARQERDELHDVCNRIAEYAVNDPQTALAELLAMDGILRIAIEKLKEPKLEGV